MRSRRVEYAIIAALAFLLCLAAIGLYALSKQVDSNKAEIARLAQLVRTLGGNPAKGASPGPVPPQRIIVEVVPSPQSVIVTQRPKAHRTAPSATPTPTSARTPSPTSTSTPSRTPTPSPSCLIPPLICP